MTIPESPITPHIQAALVELQAWPVEGFERCQWGFTNTSWVLQLPDQSQHRQLVLQLPQGATPNIVVASRDIPALLGQVGIHSPRLLYSNTDSNPSFLIREYIPGQTGNTTIKDIDSAIRLAGRMGALLPRIAQVPMDLDWLPRIWTDAALLRVAVDQWCLQAQALLSDPVRQMIARARTQIDAMCADGPVFVHGDFCPVNVLVEDQRIVGLLDLEHAQCGSRLFDAAWWGWIVRFHHPQRWVEAWPALLRAANIPNDPRTITVMESIQILRCLELSAAGCVQAHEQRATMWAERLEATLKMMNNEW